jgi:predicted MPP superfamily phosphohydrolase
MHQSSSRRAFLKTAGLATAAAFVRPALAGERANTQVAGPCIVAGPYLQNAAPDAVTVMWITDKPCVSWLEYGSAPELGNRLQNSRDGLVEAYETVHRIRIPGLTPGRPCHYRAVSQEIVRFNPYQIDFGHRVQSDVREFTPPRTDAERVSFVTFNDVHQRRETWSRLHALAAKEPFEFLAVNGDLLNHVQDHEQVVRLLIDPCAKWLEGSRPLVFVRGNHEARGQYARHLLDYFDTPGGNYYYAFTWGPVHFLVLDGGEDKPDDNKEYFGLVNFEPYLRKQAEWAAEQVKTDAFKQAAFRIVLCHIPLAARDGRADYRQPIIDALNGSGVDLAISGHTHRPAYLEPQDGRDYPVIIGGGPEPEKATAIRVNAGRDSMHVRMMKIDGTILEERTYEPKSA